MKKIKLLNVQRMIITERFYVVVGVATNNFIFIVLAIGKDTNRNEYLN